MNDTTMVAIKATLFSFGEAFKANRYDFLTEWDINHFLCNRLDELFLNKSYIKLPSEENKETRRVHIDIKFERDERKKQERKEGDKKKGGRRIDIVILDDNQGNEPHKVEFRKKSKKISYIDPKQSPFLAGLEIERLDTKGYFQSKSGVSKFSEEILDVITKLGDCKPLYRYIVIADFFKGSLEEYSGVNEEGFSDMWLQLTKKARKEEVELFYAGSDEYGFMILKNGQLVLA